MCRCCIAYVAADGAQVAWPAMSSRESTGSTMIPVRAARVIDEVAVLAETLADKGRPPPIWG